MNRENPDTMAKYESIGAIERAIPKCKSCPRLVTHCSTVAVEKRRAYADETYWGKPVPGFGDHNAKLLLVGLAPAAHGANRTGRMFTGDSSGDWLFDALHKFGFANQKASINRNDGLTLDNCYVSAAARCAPPQNKPTTTEMDRCQKFLAAELSILKPQVVIALGRIGWERYLKASGWWTRLSPGQRPPFGHNSATTMPDGVTLICSYHPSRQNTNTGRLTRKMWYGVFERARATLGRSERSPFPRQP